MVMKDIELEKIFKALANKRRLEILKLLKNRKEMTVGHIAEKIKLSIRSTSNHLGILNNAKLLDKEQRKLHVFYCLDANVPEIVKLAVKLL